jgi:hypothetical protein
MVLLVVVGAFSLVLGCVDVVEHRTTTVIERTPLEPYSRRIPAEDRINLETAWDGNQLVVRVLREQMSVQYGAERRTVEEATVREPVTWVPIIVDGSLAAAALAAIVTAQATKPHCRGGVFDEGCGAGSLIVTAFAGATLAGATGLLLGNLYIISDIKKRTVSDVPTGTMQRRLANTPVPGERVTLRFEDNTELAAETDALGVTRLRVPADRVRPGVRATLSLSSGRVRTIDLGAARGAP